MTSQEMKGKLFLVPTMFYSLGLTLNAVIFQWLESWKTVILFTQLLPTVLLALGFMLLMVDTPFDLIVFHNKKHALKCLNRIAAFNRRPSHLKKSLRFRRLTWPTKRKNTTPLSACWTSSVTPPSG